MAEVLFEPLDKFMCAVQFRYDAEVVELLKRTVPSSARVWAKTVKRWEVDTSWRDILADALRRNGHTVHGLDEPKAVQAAGTWAQALFTAVGPVRVAATHRALTKVLHPDNPETGSAVLQRQLNDARPETR